MTGESRMDDQIPEQDPSFELPTGEKRSLRTAIDGSPARPDSKCVRGNENHSSLASEHGEQEESANVFLCTRFVCPLLLLQARSVRLEGLSEKNFNR